MAQAILVDLSTKGSSFVANFRLGANAFLTDQAYLQAFQELQGRIESELAGGESFDRVVLNLAEMAYIQSMAISGLLRLQNDLKKLNVELRLSDLSEDVLKVLTIMNLEKHFSIFKTEADAMA